MLSCIFSSLEPKLFPNKDNSKFYKLDREFKARIKYFKFSSLLDKQL